MGNKHGSTRLQARKKEDFAPEGAYYMLLPFNLCNFVLKISFNTENKEIGVRNKTICY